MLLNRYFLGSFVLITFFQLCVAHDKVPYFRILAPQFLCSSSSPSPSASGVNSSDSEFVPPSSITVALQTRGSERLIYRVQVFFKLLDGFKSQRHTLSVWRSIRVLEKKIRDTREDISMKNQIDILNNELVPGVEYTFSIVGVDDQGNVSPAQNFTITYRGTDSVGFDQESGSSGGDISFLLVGTWSIYRNMPFLMQGVIIFCNPTPFYEFHWRMSGLTEDITTKYVDTYSKTLFLPDNLLESGSSHEVSVEVKSEGEIIAKALGTVNIMSRYFQIQLVPNNQSIGINREIIYQVLLDNYEQDQDKISVTWDCIPQSPQGQCNRQCNPGEPLSCTFSYSKSGVYKVTTSVTLNGIAKTDSAFVHVEPHIIASVEVKSINPFEVVAGKSFTAIFRIHFIIPECTAEWHSIASDSRYQSLEGTEFVNGLGRMDLQDLEENFLSELIEYENDTTSYEITLTVPEASEDFKGFIGNGIYLFRLVIQCPGLVDEDNGNLTVIGPKVSSYTDLILRSNEPPCIEALDVSPKNGTALQTVFKFSTAPALDSPGDYPMRYKFYYRVDNVKVLVGDYYENTVTSVELPYSKPGVQTMYEVCDSRNACASVTGPVVQVSMAKALSDGDMMIKMDAMKGSLQRRDYDEFFERSLCLIWSVYGWNDMDQKNEIKKFVHDLMIKELGTMVQRGSGNEYSLVVLQNALEGWYIIAKKVDDQLLKDEIKEIKKILYNI